MANSADPDQLAQKPTDLDLHCLQRQDISGFSRTKVNVQRKKCRTRLLVSEKLKKKKINK